VFSTTWEVIKFFTPLQPESEDSGLTQL